MYPLLRRSCNSERKSLHGFVTVAEKSSFINTPGGFRCLDHVRITSLCLNDNSLIIIIVHNMVSKQMQRDLKTLLANSKTDSKSDKTDQGLVKIRTRSDRIRMR